MRSHLGWPFGPFLLRKNAALLRASAARAQLSVGLLERSSMKVSKEASLPRKRVRAVLRTEARLTDVRIFNEVEDVLRRTRRKGFARLRCA